MNVNFTKMSGSGNDFIVIDNREKIVKNPSDFAKKYCHRKFGIDADGLLLVEKSKTADFKMRYYNSDGSFASFCGNGSRCIALFAYLKKIAPQKMRFDSDADIISAEIVSSCKEEFCYDVKVKMPQPKDIRQDLNVNVENKIFKVSFINTGVPHAVIFVKNIKDIDVNDLGKKIRWHKEFKPEGTNVNFVQVTNKSSLHVRTYERGVEAETLACGTGVVASSVISILKEYVSSKVNVLTQGGEILKVYYEEGKIHFEGKVSSIFEGQVKI
ncbi:MAG: diaminopimelate epimerase [Elusimicrobia bacterium]|nr:diaminopimelate epimerase [Elusimicrobiota bacterium]